MGISAGSDAAAASLPTAQWEHFPHDADIGVRGIGPTLADAFEQAALAMMAVIADLEKVDLRESVAISCEAPEPDLLFVDWLNALVFEMATQGLLFGAFRVEIRDHRLTATAEGEPVDQERHEPSAEVKGATFTELAVEQRADGAWVAQCIVDV
jgi:tRNA nucleotidyltransferase (CCA-adding enzyme)